MRLEPKAGEPGLWVNPAWPEGTPGTFAVVVGVSRYPHLEGGTAPAEDGGKRWIKEARALGQLCVSAHTACRFFRWLGAEYRCAAAPIAQCWLLLSPTQEEAALEGDIAGHAAPATLSACEAGLKAWCRVMSRLSIAAQHGSRAMFFFSGHGLQVFHDAQILLPSDYLGGDVPNWDDALGTQNLLHGLASLEIPHRYYFVDACRNDFPEIRAKQPRGRSILPVDEAAMAYPGTEAMAVLYATAPSLQAWQPQAPQASDDGLSLYGRALLEGLRGRPDIELRVAGDTFEVGLNKLQGFTRGRITELLQAQQAVVRQPTVLGGYQAADNPTVTEIPKDLLAVIRPAVAGPPTRGPGDTLLTPDARTPRERAGAIERGIAGAFLPPIPVATAGVTRWDQDFGLGHALFGSEAVTELFSQRLQLSALGTGEKLEPSALALRQVERDGDTEHYRLEVSITRRDKVGYWLAVLDHADVAHGVVLPADDAGTPLYRLEVDLARLEPHGRLVTRFEGFLSERSPGPLGEAAQLWQRYRFADVTEAVSAFEFGQLERMVHEKLESPLAATVAALILLRANRVDLLHNWTRNLALWFPHLPDGPVLWAEHLLRPESKRGTRTAAEALGTVTQAAEALGLLLARGLPLTSEAVSYLGALVVRLRAQDHRLPEGVRAALEPVGAAVDAALPFFRPGGLFASYAYFTMVPPWTPSGGAIATAAKPISVDKPGSTTPAGNLAANRIAAGEGWVDIGGVRLRRRRTD